MKFKMVHLLIHVEDSFPFQQENPDQVVVNVNMFSFILFFCRFRKPNNKSFLNISGLQYIFVVNLSSTTASFQLYQSLGSDLSLNLAGFENLQGVILLETSYYERNLRCSVRHRLITCPRYNIAPLLTPSISFPINAWQCDKAV